MKRVFLLVMCLVAIGACKKAAPTEAAPAAEAQPEPPKPVPAVLPDELATVNGETVTKAEFEAALQGLEQNAGGQVPADKRDAVYRDMLDQMIGYKLLTQEAKSRKIEIPEAEVIARLEMLKGHFGSPEAFTKALADQKMTLDQLKEQTRGEMQLAKMMETEVESKVKVEEKDLQEYFTRNPDQFKQPEQVRASHILIAVAADADAKTKDAAKAKAADLLKQIKGGADFAALAGKHSADEANAKQGGDLGFFGKGQMVGEFERAAFGLQKPGDVSELVETPFGFHIIKLAEKKAESTMSLEQIKPQLESFLKNQKRQDLTMDFVKGLRSKGKVDVKM
ncbi:MAG: peptidylprolyl isomerase [Vicinamibacterales bacterium]